MSDQEYAGYEEYELASILTRLEHAPADELDTYEIEKARDRLNELLARLMRKAA